jgi:hypothetical protein
LVLTPVISQIRAAGAKTLQELGSIVDRVQDQLAALNPQLKRLASPAWTNIPGPYANGWVVDLAAADAGSVNGLPPNIAYTVIAGEVRFRGLVSSGTAAFGATGTVITMPVGLRCRFEQQFASVSSVGYGQIQAMDNGDIRVSIGNHVDFSGVRYLAEQ